MKTYKELRQEAWKILNTSWSWRVIAFYIFIFCLGVAVVSLFTAYLEQSGVQTWETFSRSRIEAMQSGLDLQVPSMRQWWSMTGATMFLSFFQNILYGIGFLGMSTVLLRAVRNRGEGWFGAACTGFRQPFGAFWLVTLMMLRILLWALLFIIPGIIASFRYAVAWYVKSDHPEYSASKCLAESGRLMKGYKWKYFCFTLSYFGWFLLILLMCVAVPLLDAFVPWLEFGLVVSPLALVMCVMLMIYLGFGHACFYEEIKRLQQ